MENFKIETECQNLAVIAFGYMAFIACVNMALIICGNWALDFNLIVRNVRHGAFPDDLSMPAQIKGTTFQTTVRVLQRMT